ncbi:MAG: haloacid dehalogenase-like hydrolase [Clostridia bacterium]|nr:haloacid dehalogenase-like hydrolase [Clostridia bacterium]
MIHINNKEKINNFKKESFYIITDFDRTLTSKESEPSMGIVPKYLGGECLEERTKIFEYYRPLELDYTIRVEEKKKIMKEWANKSFTLVSKYITQDIIDKALADANIHFREGAKEFLVKMHNKNVPVIIMSSGVGNIVEAFLKKEGSLFNNIKIVSNFFEFKEEKTYIDLDSIMATLNKEYKKIPKNVRVKIEEKENALLFGDLIEDIKMANEEKLSDTITFGFLDANVEQNLETYKSNFDVVLTDDNGFNDVINILNI